MKSTRLLLSLTLISLVIISCKKSNVTKPTTPLPSKLLLSKAEIYNSNGLASTYYYYYDDRNRLTKLIGGGLGVTDTILLSYDSDDNLINYTASFYSVTNGQIGYSTESIIITNINGQPATASIKSTGYYGASKPDTTYENLVYGVNGGKVTSMYETVEGNPTSGQSITVAYNGDNVTQVVQVQGQGQAETYNYEYNTHKNAFCNVNMKWMLPMVDGFSSGFNKNDLTKETSDIGVTTYTSVYNAQDYPTQTTTILTEHNLNLQTEKYQYIAAK